MLRMTLPCWGFLEILPLNVDFLWIWYSYSIDGNMLRIPWCVRSYFLGAISFFWGRNWDRDVYIGCWLFVKVMGVVPSMHLCHSLALAVTLPLMMTNDKVDFRHNQAFHHHSISFIYMWHRGRLGGEQNYWWCHWPIWQQRPLCWWWQMTKCSNS